MNLKHDETELIGKWVEENGQVRADTICERIKWLTSHYLKKIAISKQWGAWETLFQDPDDGRYWEQTYPQGEMQGGGPPSLKCLSREQAKAKYGNEVL
jgi:Immunity protein 27